MASDYDLYYNTITGFSQHVLRRWKGDEGPLLKTPAMALIKYKPPNPYLTAWDPVYKTRRRNYTTTSGEASLAANYADGIRTFHATVATYSRTEETLDTLYGKDPQGRWVGGPFFKYTYTTRKKLPPLRYGNEWTNPEFLRPPTTQNNASSYVAPVPSATFVDSGGGFTLNSAPRPTDLSFFIDRAYARVQAARNSSRPDRPQINSMLSIMELRDFPRLLKSAGDNLIAQGASAFLSSKFGWEPIFRDIKNLFGISLAIDKQLKEMQRLSGKPIKRKRTLFDLNGTLTNEEHNFPGGVAYRTIGPEKDLTVHTTSSWKAKAVYHTYVTWDFPYDDALNIPPEIRNILKGVQLDFNTFWNIVPWTWLVDWVSNVGDFVEKEFQSRIVDLTLIDEWVTITIEAEKILRVPTVHGANMSSPKGSPAGSAESTLIKSIKWRGIPPIDAPFSLIDVLTFNSTQQAIIASLVASKDAHVARR
jgi:hypothetical protein